MDGAVHQLAPQPLLSHAAAAVTRCGSRTARQHRLRAVCHRRRWVSTNDIAWDADDCQVGTPTCLPRHTSYHHTDRPSLACASGSSRGSASIAPSTNRVQLGQKDRLRPRWRAQLCGSSAALAWPCCTALQQLRCHTAQHGCQWPSPAVCMSGLASGWVLGAPALVWSPLGHAKHCAVSRSRKSNTEHGIPSTERFQM